MDLTARDCRGYKLIFVFQCFPCHCLWEVRGVVDRASLRLSIQPPLHFAFNTLTLDIQKLRNLLFMIYFTFYVNIYLSKFVRYTTSTVLWSGLKPNCASVINITLFEVYNQEQVSITRLNIWSLFIQNIMHLGEKKHLKNTQNRTFLFLFIVVGLMM